MGPADSTTESVLVPGADAAPADLVARFEALAARLGPALRRIAAVYAPAGDAEDLYQDILVEIWRSLPSFRGSASLGTWAYRVALNTGLKHRRTAQRRPVLVHSDVDVHAGPPADAAREDHILREFLGSLGTLDREVLILYMEGLPHAEISDVTGLSAGAVGVRIHRMKLAFRKRYTE